MITSTSSPPSTDRRSTRQAGLACLVAGVLGAASGVALAVVPAQVPDDRWSYPLDAGAYAVVQLLFAVQHLGLLAGLAALGAAGAVPATRVARAGWGSALVGMVVLTATEAWGATAGDAPAVGAVADRLGTAYGVSTLLLGVGLLALGISSSRAGAWAGWRRHLPLALGVWVFVPMLPALFGPNAAGRLAITGWMLLFTALGWALVRPDLGRS
jgi:hypothetical protein